MQNNNDHPSAFKKFFQEKGYSLVLILCLAAVGISGYVFVSSALDQPSDSQPSLSVPVRIEEEPSRDSSADADASTGQTPAASFPASDGSGDKPAPADPAQPDDPEAPEPVRATAWPVAGDMLQPYSVQELSYNATMRDWRTHSGVDLAASVGQTVTAAADGTVTASYEDDYLGVTVVVSHGDGYTTRYCNLAAEPAVQVGDTLRCGDAIGVVGETALLESGQPAHLHFEVCKDSVCVDPATFLT